ncbi:MAG: hypothetical protein ACK5LC_05490 [Coprobacillaceae bacterium]
MKKTDELLSVLNKSTTTEQLNEYIEDLKKEVRYPNVGVFFETKIEELNLKKSEIIMNSHLDRTYAYQIFNSTRTGSRDKLLALCLAMHLSLEDTNRALTLNGDNILYAKNIRDAILIYCVNKRLSLYECNILLEQKKQEILDT